MCIEVYRNQTFNRLYWKNYLCTKLPFCQILYVIIPHHSFLPHTKPPSRRSSLYCNGASRRSSIDWTHQLSPRERSKVHRGSSVVHLQSASSGPSLHSQGEAHRSSWPLTFEPDAGWKWSPHNHWLRAGQAEAQGVQCNAVSRWDHALLEVYAAVTITLLHCLLN